MSKKSKIIVLTALTVLVLAVLILIVIENVGKKSYVIRNNSDRDITSLKVVFELEEDGTELSGIYEGPLKAGEKAEGKFESVDFSDVGGEVGMFVTFDGEEEFFVYDGYFFGVFDGKLDIEFYKEDDQYRVRSSAGIGLFKNSSNTDLDDSVIYFDFEEGDWDYTE